MNINWNLKNRGIFHGDVPYFSVIIDGQEIELEINAQNNGNGVDENMIWIKPKDFAIMARKLNILSENSIDEILISTEFLDLSTQSRWIMDVLRLLCQR